MHQHPAATKRCQRTEGESKGLDNAAMVVLSLLDRFIRFATGRTVQPSLPAQTGVYTLWNGRKGRMAKELKHINRPLTDEERKQAATIRDRAQQEFPPKAVKEMSSPSGIPRRIRDARKQRGMTRYELGLTANVPSTVVRAIEQGDDVPLSQFHAVIGALGLTMELVEKT
jgi:DNA-binding XRE family transcriptional regulator